MHSITKQCILLRCLEVPVGAGSTPGGRAEDGGGVHPATTEHYRYVDSRPTNLPGLCGRKPEARVECPPPMVVGTAHGA